MHIVWLGLRLTINGFESIISSSSAAPLSEDVFQYFQSLDMPIQVPQPSSPPAPSPPGAAGHQRHLAAVS